MNAFASPLLAIRDLSVHYGKSLAVDACELEVWSGECVGIVGPNGAGKSSLLKAIAGVEPSSSGHVEFDGQVWGAVDSRTRLLGGLAMVPEGRHVFPQLSVRENLLAGGYVVSKDHRRERVEEMLERFEILHEKRETAGGLLSGGQQQLLAIARGLMARPRCLLIDEFSLGLSPNVIKKVSEFVAEMVEDGVTVLLVEQNPSILESLCSRVYLMRERRIESTFALPKQRDELHEKVRALV